MAKFTKILILLTAAFGSIACLILGLGMTGPVGMVLGIMGGIGLLMVIGWPILNKLLNRVLAIEGIGVIFMVIMSIVLFVLQAICLILGFINGSIAAGFSNWSMLALVLGAIVIFAALFIVPYITIKQKMADPAQTVGGTMVLGFLAIAAVAAPWEKIDMTTPPSISYWGFILAVVLLAAALFIHPGSGKKGKMQPIIAGLTAFPYTVLACSWAVLESYAYWRYLFTDSPWYAKVLVAIPDVVVVIGCLVGIPYLIYQFLSEENG